MNSKIVVNQIVSWLKKELKSSRQKGFVIGVSGGIDSSVVSALCAKTGYPVICLSMPINKNPRNSEIHMKWLKNGFSNVTCLTVDLTKTFKAFVTALPIEASKEIALVNSQSRLRMISLYSFSASYQYLVVGTGNKIEDYGVMFFTKWGDGSFDLNPIADLYKSEVYLLADYLGVNREITEAVPSDDLWGDGRSDEDQLGATYPELEWAMKQQELGIKTSKGMTKREKEIWSILLTRQKMGRHKIEPVPVFRFKNYKPGYSFIYVLKDPINNEVQYIGKSVDPHKRYGEHLRQSQNSWIKKLKKKNLKPTLEIIDEIPNSLWKEAEIYYIRLYKNIGYNLTNKTEGGDTPPSVNSRKVARINPKTDDLVIYESVAEAARVNKIPSCSRIFDSCNGKTYLSKGFIWRFIKRDGKILEPKCSKSRMIAQIDYKTMKIVEKYSTVYDTRKKGFDPTCIHLVCAGKKKSAYGYIWRYIKNGRITAIKPQYNHKTIEKLDLKETLIERFLDAKDAAISVNKSYGDLIIKACKKKSNAHGYKWRFGSF